MFKRILSSTVIVCFFLTGLGPMPLAGADTGLGLPVPGTMINLSPAYEPVMIKGLTVHQDNPFLFDFIVDVGQDRMSGAPLKQEGEKLIKYFLASLAIPDKDVWVNLSPYEKNRMIPAVLGRTDMGRDLLEQDYILKQVMASLIYPEKQLGKTFWDKVYAQAQQKYGTTRIPVNTFNKVWIMADRAEVFEHNQTAFVVGSHLKVMLEEDYLALQKSPPSGGIPPKAGHAGPINRTPTNRVNTLGSTIVRQLILPELEKEVNTGKNFANLRQIFNSIILSSWYKKNLKQALLNQVYANRSKVDGIRRIQNDGRVMAGSMNRTPTDDLEAIYRQYLKAYKKGVFNYIKEDVSLGPRRILPRKYFSGGMNEGAAAPDRLVTITDAAMGSLKLARQHFNGLVDFATITRLENQINALPADLNLNRKQVADMAMRGMQIINLVLRDPRFIDARAGTQEAQIIGQLNQFKKILEKNELNYYYRAGTLIVACASIFLITFYLMARHRSWGWFGVSGAGLAAGIGGLYQSSEFLQKKKSAVEDQIVELMDQLIRQKVLPLDLVKKIQEIQGRDLIYTGETRVFTYIVQVGDTLSTIARHSVITRERLAADNHISPLAQLVPGRELTIATEAQQFLYVVQPFDNMFLVGLKTGITAERLAQLNDLPEDSELFPGERLSIDRSDAAELSRQKDPTHIGLPEAVKNAPGGIDLNTSNGMQWKFNKDGRRVEMSVDPALIARVRREGIEGLSPYIIKITPVSSVWTLAGPMIFRYRTQ